MYRAVQLLAVLAYLAAGVGGLVVCVWVVYDALGFLSALAGSILFPLTLLGAPWLALVQEGTMTPLLLVYGGFGAAVSLHVLGNALRRDAADSGAGGPEGEASEEA